ncbi:MAG: helix-turn-helix domain-containing protein [Colwellia sp.]|nr:helix-turn-helix domain-containing protein [Colwellia sp.]MCW8865476.1 helix-turn-helix domain-containing protein [Colwellia sp.]MCW9082628.1 helix-turn-helix domain-containing protein [Colwellia sp.]
MKVLVLATNDCMVSAVYGVLDVFFAANYCIEKRYGKGAVDTFDCQIVTINNKNVNGYNGIEIKPTQSLVKSEVPDIIILSATVEVLIDCCGDDISLDNKEAIKQWLSHCAQQGTVISSFCTGAFLLASSGLLAGKTATTHWRSADLFRRVFPYIRLDSDKIIVDNGNVVCSGGSMSYIDLSLHLIDRFVGKDVTSDCAKLLVFDPVRQKQSPYVSFNAQKDHDDQAILKAQDWLERHYKSNVSMEALADKVGLGTRTFKRRFKLATNENPINYLQRIRVEQVKDKLEKTTNGINQIIWSVGYEDISSFRQLFKRFTGLTPREYRQKFTS